MPSHHKYLYCRFLSQVLNFMRRYLFAKNKTKLILNRFSGPPTGFTILLLNQNFKKIFFDRSHANSKLHLNELNACLAAMGNRKTVSSLLRAWFHCLARGIELKKQLNLQSNLRLTGQLSINHTVLLWAGILHC